MKKKTRLFSALISALLLLLCIFAPAHLKNALERDILGQELERRKNERFSGVIVIWQVDSFPGGVGSRAAWLASVLAPFEKKYSVRFDVKTVSPELFPQLLQSSRPDMLSFGTGLLSRESAAELLEAVNIPGIPVPAVGQYAQGLAVPLYFGAYCLLTDAAAEYDDLFSLLSRPGGTVASGRQRLPVFSLAVLPGSASAALALTLDRPLSAQPAVLAPDALWDSYNYSRTALTALCSQRQLCRLAAAEKQNRARASRVIPLNGYSDCVQAIGILKDADEKKLRVLYSVLDFLSSPEVQCAVPRIGMFPAQLSALENAVYDNPGLDTVRSSLLLTGVRTVSMFYQDDPQQALLERLTGAGDSAEDFLLALYGP